MELAKAYVQIVPSARGIKGSISDVLSNEADDAGSKAGSSIASKIKGAIGVAAIGAALGKALTEGAALEQSLGGIETLFKSSADTVIKNAQRAYKTAGLSANQYMETATSFSASLLQGLGGDTQKAAKITDMAITDMSDNANKMGTDMASIQNAYQGFAKQNYTMLDNLKLGYGGTKEEMARLLADAQKITGVKYDITNLSDVYSAIHVIQGELGVTGTTATEAATTLSGSFASMKAAAQDFLGYLTTGMDVKPAITALVKTSTTFLFENLVPALGNVIKALPSAVSTFINTAIPIILKQGKKLVDDFLPKFIDDGLKMVTNIASGISKNLPKIAEKASALVVKLTSTIASKLPQILQAGVKIVVELVSGIVKSIPKLVAAVPKLIKAIKTEFSSVDWKTVGKNIIQGIINGVGSMVGALAQAARNAGANALSAIKQRLGIASPSKVFRDQIGKFIPLGIAEGINSESKSISNALDNSFSGLDLSMGNVAPSSAANRMTSDIVNALAPNFNRGGDQTIQLVVDSKVLAQVVYNPLNQLAMQEGITNGRGY